MGSKFLKNIFITHIKWVRSKKETSAAIFHLQIFTILTVVVPLLDCKDATPPIKTHTYSHTTYITVKEMTYFEIYHLVLINSFPTPQEGQDFGFLGILWSGNDALHHDWGWYPP